MLIIKPTGVEHVDAPSTSGFCGEDDALIAFIVKMIGNGCEIPEPIRATSNVVVWGDDLAQCKANPVNVWASAFYRAVTHKSGYVLTGTYVVAGEDSDGNVRELTADEEADFMACLKKVVA